MSKVVATLDAVEPCSSSKAIFMLADSAWFWAIMPLPAQGSG
jgi:hypothetical protein